MLFPQVFTMLAGEIHLKVKIDIERRPREVFTARVNGVQFHKLPPVSEIPTASACQR